MAKKMSVEDLAIMVEKEFRRRSLLEEKRFLAIEQRLSRIEAWIEKWNNN